MRLEPRYVFFTSFFVTTSNDTIKLQVQVQVRVQNRSDNNERRDKEEVDKDKDNDGLETHLIYVSSPWYVFFFAALLTIYK